MSRLSRMPVRLRVTLAFIGMMVIVLGATALFVYLRLEHELDTTIKNGLRARAGDVSALIAQADSGLEQSGRSPLTERGENLAQILDARGTIVDSTALLRSKPVLTHAQLERALVGTVTIAAAPVTGEGDPARLLATPVTAQGRRLVVVVGTSLEDHDDALRSLAGLLLVGGAAALVLASLAGYGAVASALRPVERMRRRAAAIQQAGPAERLPVSPANDELGRLGLTLNAMLGRLDESFERERSFVSDASHELRTPLAILKAEIELALRGGQSVAELEEALRSAGEETDRLVQLAEDLLVIARSDQGRLPIRHEKVVVGELLEGARTRFAARAEAQDATLVCAVEDADATLVADGLRLEQALGNLVDNALRHGGPDVEITSVVTADAVELHVLDNGPGFPQDFLPTAFERFARADVARGRGRGGSGLGLAIVKSIAMAHGGSVGATNRPEGGGADVWLRLPRNGSGQGAVADPPPPPSARSR